MSPVRPAPAASIAVPVPTPVAVAIAAGAPPTWYEVYTSTYEYSSAVIAPISSNGSIYSSSLYGPYVFLAKTSKPVVEELSVTRL